jgi:Tol biopolymer transport system component
MALSPGRRLGSYEILGPLGAGGMGEVYRARDSRLDRAVALKILPASVAADPDRRARFEREAKAIASLNHPGIVTIHSIEDIDGVQFLTMELVDGRTLDDVISHHGLPLERLLKIAIPLTDAVSAAHQGGIMHRDLKPANVMVGEDGRVKVLDFGLAKLRESAGLGGESETDTRKALTGEGRIVGTVAYMSPEQAEGRAIDHRSDIFSIGILLYKMATGERPFTGETSVSILSSIIKDTPRLVTEVNPRLPKELGRIVRRCLVKDPEHRYQTTKDLRNDLEELQQSVTSGELAAEPQPGRVSRGARWAWIVGAVVLIALAAVLIVRDIRSSGRGAAPTVAATFTQITSQAGMEQYPSLSPDGEWIVYSAPGPGGDDDIFLQSVDGQTAIDLTKDSPAPDLQPTFSADGKQIAFRSERQGGGIFIMGRTGGFARRVSDAGYNPTWSPDGRTIAYSTVSVDFNPYGRGGVGALWTVDAASGGRHEIYKGDAVQPTWSPHGQRIAFWTTNAGNWQRDILTISAQGGEPVAVTNDTPTDFSPAWAPDGQHLFFVSDRGGSLNLWRMPLDEASGRVNGPPEAVTTNSPRVAGLTISADGRRLAYSGISYGLNIQRCAVDPAAGVTKDSCTWITTGSTPRPSVDVSRDGDRLVMWSGLAQEDIFVSNPDGSDMRQLTNDPARDRFPTWSPDGRLIAFYSNRSGKFLIWTMNSDGTGLRQPIENMENLIYPEWNPDGTRMAGSNIRDWSVWLFDPRKSSKDQQPERLPPGPVATFIGNAWSADGRYLAGWGDAGPGIVVYDLALRTYDVLTQDRGWVPRWLGADRLVYVQGDRRGLKLVELKSKRSREFLSAAPDQINMFSLSHDGRQLYLTRGPREADIWMATLK